MGNIENWSIVYDESDPYMAPELRTARVNGELYGDRRRDDGEYITSSEIRAIDIDNMEIRTKNTTYKLGKVSKGFEQYLKDNDFRLNDYKRNCDGEI